METQYAFPLTNILFANAALLRGYLVIEYGEKEACVYGL